MPRVAHMTAVHPADDVRIFAKECRSLAAAGYQVDLVVPGASDGVVDGVAVHGVAPPAGGRLGRMTRTALDVYRAARRLDADLYHVHDPELLPAALMLRGRGKQVVYDSHEHLPQQIVTKPWIPAEIRRPLARVADVGERLAVRRLSAVVTAEPYVARRFEPVARKVVTVNNFPSVAEFDRPAGDWPNRERAVCYAGAITELRGVGVMLEAIARTNATLLLAGRFSPAHLEQEVKRSPGWESVDYLGQLPRPAVGEMMSRAQAGLVVLRAIPNYLEANPIKMFEYMAAGIPVIASDFPAWRGIVESHECGICVDPESADDVAAAIWRIVDNPEDAQRMGENGRRAARSHYSWETERATLLELYRELVGPPAE